MKKGIITFVALSLFLTTQVFAAGSGTGGSTKPDTTSNEAAQSTSTESVTSTAKTEAKAEVSVETTVSQDVPTKTVTAVSKTKYCNDLDGLKDRIKCRLQKSQKELEEELAAVYMPEECRATEDAKAKSDCVERYKSLKPCWKEKPGAGRIECVKKQLGINKLIDIEEYCKGRESSCKDEYRAKVYHLITFRFYDAEERAEEWYEEGKLSLDETVDFTAVVVQSKLDFSKAKTKAERVAVIKSMQMEWEKLVAKVK